MTTQTDLGQAAAEALKDSEPVAAKGESTYVVLVERQLQTGISIDEPGEPMGNVWVDVATVSVPARTKRKGIIAKALNDAGITPQPGQPAPRVRVLDEESAFVHEPEAKQPPAEWVV